jgi:hypothetical protein
VLDQVRVQLLDLLLGDVDLLERGGDLLEGQIALVTTEGDQPPQFLRIGERRVLGDCP